MSKQAYYKYKDHFNIDLILSRFVLEYVEAVREEDPAIGGEKLWYMYCSYFGDKYSLGRDAFLTILRTHGLLLRKKSSRCKTTDSSHGLPLYPDLIKDLHITRPFQVWVSDITYIRMRDDFCFLSLVTDAYNREILGYCVGPTLETCHTLEAFEQTLCKAKAAGADLSNLIHHSDRGCQYASYAYTSVLKENGIKISMTESGDPKDNAIAERVNGILKTEFLNHHEFEDIEQVRVAVNGAVEFYNTRRPHRSLDMLTPRQAAQKTGTIDKRWISYKDKYRDTEGGSPGGNAGLAL